MMKDWKKVEKTDNCAILILRTVRDFMTRSCEVTPKFLGAQESIFPSGGVCGAPVNRTVWRFLQTLWLQSDSQQFGG